MSLRQWLSRPSALLTIDVQHMFVADGGWFHRLGFDVAPMQAALPHIARTQDLARGHGVPLVDIKSVDDAWSNWPCRIVSPRFVDRLENIAPGDPADRCALSPETAPAPGEAVVSKHAHDAFYGTPLSFVLRKMACETVVLSGVTTRGCVEATARSAFARGFAVVVVREAVADPCPEMHEAALHFIAEHIGIVASADEVRAALPKG